MKVTIDLDPELYRAVKVEAARADRSVREIVDEALATWLERLEDAEDAAAAVEALAEYQRDGGIAADVADHHRILHEVDTCLGEEFNLEHSTIQVEYESRPLESHAHA